METKSVVLEISEEILERGEKIAAEQQISLSDLVSRLLREVRIEKRVDSRVDDPEYNLAMQRQLALMKEGLPFGIGDKVEWTREELHER